MRRPVRSLFAALFVVSVSSCAAGSAPRRAAGDGPQAPAIIRFDRQVVTFEPTRRDITVAGAVVSVHCSQVDEVRLNDAEPGSTWNYLPLARVATNRFELAPLKIEYAGIARGIVCVSVKVFFHEVSNTYDSLFYRNPDDRYALVSWCSNPRHPDWERARHRFAQNRVETLAEFREALARPFVIELNQRPLSDVARFQSRR